MKTTIITGTSQGIGFALAKNFLQKNFFVHGIGRRHTLEDPNYFPHHCDFKDLKKLDKPSFECPTPDVLVINAGIGLFGHLEQLSFKSIEEIISVNLVAPIFIIKHFLPKMKKREKGDIIIIGSESAYKAEAKGSVYSATKFGLRGFAKSLRKECAKKNIRVTLINPGMVKTDFFNSLDFEPGDQDAEHLLPSDVVNCVSQILEARAGCHFDEIMLTPQKHKIHFKKS